MQDNRLHQLLDLGNHALDADTAPEPEQLDFMMPAILRHSRKRITLTLVNRDKLLHALLEFFRISLRQFTDALEFAEGEEMDTTRRMVIIGLRGDATSGGGKRNLHFRLGPRKRLDTPFLPKFTIMLKRHLVTIAHDDIVERESARAKQPFVRSIQLLGRNITLRRLDRRADNVRTEDRTHQHFTALRRRQRRQFPEPPVQQRKRRDGMIASGNRQHPPFSPALQFVLRHDQYARSLVEMTSNPIFEDERIVTDIPGREQPLPPHRNGLHLGRTLHTRFPDSREELTNGVHEEIYP